MKFCDKKSLIFILVCLLVLFALYYYSVPMIEANTSYYTSCTQLNGTSCSQCVNAGINNAKYPCWWNESIQKCGSFNDTGYSKLCRNQQTLKNKLNSN